MKIVDIKTTLLIAPLKTPFITSLRRVEALEDLVVIITCDEERQATGREPLPR